MSKKKVLQVRVKTETITLLKKIADIEKRNLGTTFDLIIEKIATEKGITLEDSFS